MGASGKMAMCEIVDLALHTREMVPGRHQRSPASHNGLRAVRQLRPGLLRRRRRDNPKAFPSPRSLRSSLRPEPGGGAFDQRGQTVHGPQTNIAGDVHGPVFSGQFSGPVSMGGEAIDMRGSTGAIYKPTGPVRQHFGDKIEIHGDGNVIGSGSAAVLKGANMERFLKDLQSLRQALQDANLDEETVQAVDSDLQIVQAQAGKERPNKTMIMSKLRSASEILAAVEGSVGTIERVQALASSLLSFAGRLFG